MFSLFIGITLYKYIVEEREKRKIKGAFAHYLSQDVLEQVLSSPGTLKLGGEKKISLFFSRMLEALPQFQKASVQNIFVSL